MHISQLPYRGLIKQLDDCDNSMLEPVIEKWLTSNTTELAWIEGLRRLSGDGIPTMSIEDSWRLYGLSRVSDALITLVAKDRRRAHHFITFMEGLDLHRVTAERFHPFYHEVVEVISSSTLDAPIEIKEVIWPGFMCGPLMIARAGVSVTGGAVHIRKDIAETSTLYWSYRRAERPTEDLSLGWGSNSQWRTSFRRDYCLRGQYYYNVDGDSDPGDPVLSEHERLELLRHRCFVLAEHPHADLFPYGLRHNEPIA
jgi:hypothetical protein